MQLSDSIENEPGMKPSAHVAAVHSLISGPVQVVHTVTDVSDAKSWQQKPPVDMKVSKPSAHVAAVQSLISVPLHEVHAFTDGSDALQHPVNDEKVRVSPSHDTTG